MKRTSATILIVDDEPGARETLEALLYPEGYDLRFACNGKEALQKAEQFTPSLILLDVMMPEMDGFEVCRRLRSIPLLAEVPVIMITALDDRDSRLQGIESGADDFLSKPFDFNELRVRIRTIVRLDRYRRLLQERVKFEWVVQHANDGYVIVNDAGSILYANSLAQLYLGLPTDPQGLSAATTYEKLHDTFLTLIKEQYHLEPQAAWASWPAQAVGQMPRYLLRPETSTAEAFWLQVDSLDVPSESNTDRILRLRDVTAQIVSHRNRRGFHTMICHKLRTPMVGLLGGLRFMVQNATALSKDEVFEFSEMALNSVERLHGEIEDILQYLHTSGADASDEGFQLAQLQDLISLVCTNLKLDHVNLSIQAEVRSHWFALSQQAVELILWEILENSKKFHPQQTPDVEIFVMPGTNGNSNVRLKIQDNGLSLSPEQLSHMWIPYYQGEKYSTGEAKGMGLGLSTVASLVWEIGGTCRAYNRKDSAGIVVELVLPALVWGSSNHISAT